MADKPANPDREIARLAARQHGVVSSRQLRSAGLSRDAVLKRTQRGRLHRIHRGVYAVGHPALAYRGRCMAATLACGDKAALSHRSAAALWRLLPHVPGPVHVSVPSDSGRERRTDIHIHRRKALSTGRIRRRYGIPVTSPAQTVADLKAVVSPSELRRAIRQAEVLGLRTGIETKGDRTRSELEHLFLRLCKRHQLPRPEVNVRVGSHLVDFLWPEHRLIVETDGYRYHRGQAAFERDHDRDLELRKLGYDVLRLTFRQVTKDPAVVADLLAEELQRHPTQPDVPAIRKAAG